jgi:hypothetical protein
VTRHSRCGPTSRARTSSRASWFSPTPARREARCGPRSSLPLDVLLASAGELLDAIALLPVDRALLLSAGALAEPALPALDAIQRLRMTCLAQEAGPELPGSSGSCRDAGPGDGS